MPIMRTWTQAEEICLREAIKDHDLNVFALSRDLGVEPSVLRSKIDRMRKNRTRKERTCLRCSKMFMSHGPGNRICRSCSKTVNDAYDPTVVVV